MNYIDIENDVRQLVGLRLNSIIAGSEITIIGIESAQNRIVLETSAGKIKSRPLDELRKIWEELQRVPAVHVDRVLNGSGSSRNQPETILANLPYIEWLRIDGKKHIAFVGKSTHPYGTLKEMSPADAATLVGSRCSSTQKRLSSLIITRSLREAIEAYKKVFSGTIQALEQGLYLFESDFELVLFCTPETFGLREGTYATTKMRGGDALAKRIILLGTEYGVFIQDEMKLLVW